jgi:hypothetical protein
VASALAGGGLLAAAYVFDGTAQQATTQISAKEQYDIRDGLALGSYIAFGAGAGLVVVGGGLAALGLVMGE